MIIEPVIITALGLDITPAIQVLLALLLGVLLGTERTLAHKNAGLRVFGLVAMGSALFTVTAMQMLPTLAGFNTVDVFRVVSGVVTGVGFLGAGVIIFRENSVRGLSTAAAIWVASGIGVAAGFGLYGMAVFITLLTLLVFTVFTQIEKRVRHLAEDDNDPGKELDLD